MARKLKLSTQPNSITSHNVSVVNECAFQLKIYKKTGRGKCLKELAPLERLQQAELNRRVLGNKSGINRISDDSVTLERLEKALVIAAKVIECHGEKYVPLFERLEREIETRRRQTATADRARILARCVN